MRTTAVLLHMAATLGLLVGAADARIRIRTPLTATAADADASGRARLVVTRPSEARFKLTMRGLDGAAAYDVIVADVRVATVATNDRGRANVSFRTRPRGNDLPLGFDPRGATIVVRTLTGGDVLVATVRRVDPKRNAGDIVCCIPDDSGTECEDRTPAECDAAGGTVVAGATSCLPNPCAGAQPVDDQGDIVCCLPDDSGPECEDRTQAECLAAGGVVVRATSCLPDPCATSCTPETCGPAGGGGGGATVDVTCERRAGRSKISVDGRNLAPGSYQARALSGAQAVTAPAASTIGDEVEFDFDSAPDDIAAGATAIAADFIAGNPPEVTGQILDLGGAVLVESTVICAQK